MRTSKLGLVAILVVAACGPGGGTGDDVGDDVGDDSNEPVLVPGGGVTGAPVAGKVNVFVIAQDTGAPIAGANVQIGDALGGTTDADGLAVITDAALTGGQTVTATASGRVASTWFGVIGTSATIPLEPAATPQARVSGSITGWDSLPDPDFGNYNLAVILYSLTDDIGAPENHLAQPGGSTPANTCIKSAFSNMCAWQMNARVGPQRHFAAIVEGDPQGTTEDPSDDTYQLIGYAIGASMTLTDGQSVTGENLTIVPAGQRSPMTVGIPAAPGGLGDVIAIPMLDLGGDGRLPFPLPAVTPASASTEVITPSGDFAGTYDVVALATPPGAAAMPYSTGFARGASVGGTTQLPAWLPAPSVAAAGGTYTITGGDGASVRYATFTRGTTRLWSVSVLDGSTAFTLPALAVDPLGTGSATIEVTAADVTGFDAAHFSVGDVTGALVRASGAQATFTP
jgi:hypothetical protein